MRRIVRLAAGSLAAAVLATAAGCSGGSSTPSAASNPTPTPVAAGSTQAAPTSPTPSTASAAAQTTSSGGVSVCSLLTAAQASKLNKVTYSSATPGHLANGFDTCKYKNNGSPDPINIQDLTVTVVSLPGCWSSLQSADGPGKSLPGLGDAAFGTEIGADIEVGSRCVTLQGLTHAEFQGDYRPDTAMAKIILANLH
jgi:hypothetical protein